MSPRKQYKTTYPLPTGPQPPRKVRPGDPAYCRKGPARRHHMICASPTTAGVKGVCMYCRMERWYPHTTDTRYVPLTHAQQEFPL